MDPRLEVVEARVEEQSRNWDRLEARFAQIDQRFAQIDERFALIEQTITALDDKLSMRIDGLERKFDDLRGEMSKQFRWMMGTMVMLFATMLTLGGGIITALLTNSRQG